ncbi:hypothetical protein PS421_09250 [Pediococcus pentosaceus]|uniref:hypothetical protein n=1 Tax=Pediococcus pentosaceus TaxID=1255 RepID=UPI002F266BD9
MDKIIEKPSYKNAINIMNREKMEDLGESKVPFLTKENNKVFVSGFGNTLKTVNGDTKENSGFDWYYKGNGNGLIGDKSELQLPTYGLWGGVETEIVMIHVIDKDLTPVYLGYTLGIDFTNTGLRRRENSFKNLSHISKTAIAEKVVLTDFPDNDILHTNITRNGKVIWNKDALVGGDNMWERPEVLISYLFRNQEILIPGNVFYTLTGASMSSDKAGIHLKNGDKINSYLRKESIFLESTFKEVLDE